MRRQRNGARYWKGHHQYGLFLRLREHVEENKANFMMNQEWKPLRTSESSKDF